MAYRYKSKHLRVNSKILSIIIAIFFAVDSVQSQDIHFTQFYASPLTLNPALTGLFDGDWRFTGNYRNQWRSIGDIPFTTFSLGFDKPIRIYSEQLNIGVVFLNDQSGIVNLTTNRFYGNISYSKKIGKQLFSIGIQPGYIMEGYDLNKYSFNEQFDLGNKSNMFNKTFNAFETLNDGLSFFDLNSGVYWNGKLTDAFSPFVGFTLYHITRPNRSFSKVKSDTTRFGLRNAVQIGASIKLGQRTRLKPNIINMYEKGATEMLAGSNIEYDLTSSSIKTVYAGAEGRYGWNNTFDATTIIAGAIWKSFNVGFSYDLNMSNLRTATDMKGAWEISVIYISKSTKPTKLKIPCDRY